MTPPDILANAIAALEKTQRLIISAAMASCECHTKTPEAAFHDPMCRYSKLEFALEEVESTLASLRSVASAPADQSDAGRDGVIEDQVREFERLLKDYGNGCVLCMSAHVHIVSTDFEAREKAVVDAYRRALKSAAPAEAVGRPEDDTMLSDPKPTDDVTIAQAAYFSDIDVKEPGGKEIYQNYINASSYREAMGRALNAVREHHAALPQTIPTADRAAIREALKVGLRFARCHSTTDAEVARDRITAALALLGEG